MNNKAYPYIRYSTLVQEKGDSTRRQQDKAKVFADSHNLDLDTSLNLIDAGISAYKGANIEDGELKRFVNLVKNGDIAKGSCLLIENFDRFSRMNPHKAIGPFLDLINSGIKFAIIDDNKIYSDKDGLIELLAVIVSMERSHQESEAKSIKIRAAKHNAKMDLLAGKRQTLWKWNTPKWLEIADDDQGDNDTGYLINHDRVKIIHQILDWVIEGFGTTWILNKLSSLEIHPWDSSCGIKVSKQPKQWYGSSINKLLHNRALVGEFHMVVKDEDGTNKRTEVISNHFPKVVLDEKFNAALLARKSRKNSSNPSGIDSRNEHKNGGGRRGKTNSNLFQKLAVCGYSVDNNDSQFRCADNNRPMAYTNKDKTAKNGKRYISRYLQCSASKSPGGPCKGVKKYYAYEGFERAFLTHIKDISVSTLFGTEKEIQTDLQNIITEIQNCKNSIESSEQQIKKYITVMEESDSISPSMLGQITKHETVAAESKNQLEILEQQKNAVEKTTTDKNDIKYQLSSMIEHMAACQDEDDLFNIRVKLSALLKKYIYRIEVYNNGSSGEADPVGTQILQLREQFASVDILDEKNRKRIDEFEEDLQQMQKTSRGGINPPYFVVRYLSGNSRLVLPNPNDPTKIRVQVLTDSKHNVLTTYADWVPTT